MAAVAPVIEVAGVSKRYRRVEAVSDVSLTIYPGEVFGLLGPDGAGKSTILQVRAGVLPPTRGQAAVAGIDVLRDPERVKARIGYMPQGLGLNLYDDLTVDEHLRFFAELRGVPEDRFREHRATLLEITRLAPARTRAPPREDVFVALRPGGQNAPHPAPAADPAGSAPPAREPARPP